MDNDENQNLFIIEEQKSYLKTTRFETKISIRQPPENHDCNSAMQMEEDENWDFSFLNQLTGLKFVFRIMDRLQNMFSQICCMSIQGRI